MTDKPKVLLLGPLPPPYMGPAIATEILLNSRLKNNFQLIHLNTSTHKTISTLGSWRLSVFFKNAGFYFRLVCLIVHHRPEIVLIPISQTTNGFIKDSVFIIISRLFRRKTILQLRGSNFKNWLSASSRLTRRYVRFILKMTQGMIVLGEKLRDLFIEYYHEDLIFVVPNGANYKIQPVAKTGTALKLLYLSNMQPSKGIEDVLEAIPLVSGRNKKIDFELDVVGSWRVNATRDRCLKIVDDAKLRVHFHSPAIGSEKFKFLTHADLFIFTPREPEGHPWVIVEAMAACLPIISTDQGAITESVIDGFNGFIVEKRSPEQIAEKIILIAKNKKLRERMGRNSRKLYEEKFTEEKMVANLANCFNQVMGVHDVEHWFTDLSDRWWKNYASGDKNFIRRLKNVHLLLDNQGKKSRILDIGCGTGEITASVAERFLAKTTGIDVSAKMVGFCRTKYSNKNLIFSEGNILDLHFSNEQFDLVLSLSVIEWIVDYKKAMGEVSRVLKPGGQWIVSLPNWRSPFRKLEYFRSFLLKKSYLRFQRNRVSIKQFLITAKKLGMTLDKMKYHVLPVFDVQPRGKLGEWLGMMCIMSMKKVGD